MTRIDRYILVLYVRVFAVCFVTLAGLLIVAQVFTNLDEFIQYGKARGSLIRALVEYYSPALLAIFDRTCGLLVLLSSMFVIAWLYRTNEMTALLAAGISKARIIRPILMMSLVAIVFAAVSRECLIPKWEKSLSKSPQDLQGGERLQPIRPTVDVDYGVLIAGRNLETNSQSIINPVFKFQGPVAEVVEQIHAARAVYDQGDGTRPTGYRLEGVTAKSMLPGKPSIRKDGIDYLLLPTDNPWLSSDQCFIPSKVEYDMLQGGSSQQFASTAELIWRLRNQGDYYGSDLQVMVHTRFLQPWMDMTLLLLGLPLILTTRSRNLVQLALVCVGTFGLFFAVATGFGSLAERGTLFSPSAAAWGPLILFGPIAYARARQAMME
ncbi:MAG: LptF/LptG family permease [Planctomycetota bacterium]|jgi:lipopolysaccharide export system permease protein